MTFVIMITGIHGWWFQFHVRRTRHTALSITLPPSLQLPDLLFKCGELYCEVQVRTTLGLKRRWWRCR